MSSKSRAPEYDLSDVALKDWTSDQLASYIKSKGLGCYAEMFKKHNVDGQVAHALSDDDLREMGMDKVGDRLKMMNALEAVRRAKGQQDREKVIWKGEELLFFSCWGWCCATCCGCCPKYPQKYTLYRAHLEIKTEEPNTCGPIRCCCGHSYNIDTVDILNITDTDVRGVPPSCCDYMCCGHTQEHLTIKTSVEGDKILKLDKGEGQDVARKINNQVEVVRREVMDRE